MKSGNPILDKNLKCIERYNSDLAEQILNLPHLTNSIELIETELKEPNLSFNGLPLHSQKGAEAEAKELFKNVANTKMSRHIVFGMGLGYLFKEFCENSKGAVFLYEPNLEILRVTLELVDFSKELRKKNVYVTTDKSSFMRCYARLSKYKVNTPFTALPSYSNVLYKEQMPELTKEFKEIVGAHNSAYELSKKVQKQAVETILKNLPETIELLTLNEFQDIYKDKTALVISAGPTLDRNIETIKKNKDKVVIFCVGQAFKALHKHGIKPDFVAAIEVNDFSGQLKGFDLSDVNFILEPCTNNAFYQLETKKKYLFPSKDSGGNKFWSHLTGVDISSYTIKGTVSYAAIASAQMLGCKTIALIGQDLAFVNNQCYSNSSIYGGMEYKIKESGELDIEVKNKEEYTKAFASVDENADEEAAQRVAKEKIEVTKHKIYYIKGISGEMIPSIGAYAAFIDYFTEFAMLNPDLNLINTSMVGAQIDGFKNIPFEEVVKDLDAIEKVDISTIPKPLRYDNQRVISKLNESLITINSILTNLTKGKKLIIDCEEALEAENAHTEESAQVDEKLKNISDILSYLPDAKEYLIKYEEQLLKKKEENPKILELKKKCVQELIPIHKQINRRNDDNLFKSLSYSENLEIKYVLENSEELTSKEIIILYSLFKDYFFNIEENCLNVANLIKEQKEVIKEKMLVKK